jgi:hypothetical protein
MFKSMVSANEGKEATAHSVRKSSLLSIAVILRAATAPASHGLGPQQVDLQQLNSSLSSLNDAATMPV